MRPLMCKSIRPFLVVLLVSLGLAGCSSGFLSLRGGTSTPPVPVATVDPHVLAEGHLVPRDFTHLVFLASGDISELLVKEGDLVDADALLVRLGNREAAEAAVTTAQMEKLSAETALKTLRENWDIAKSAAELAQAQAQIAYDKAKDHRDGMDYPRGTQTDLDNAWSSYQLALSQVATAQTTYDRAINLADNNPLKAKAILDLTTAQKARDQTLATYNWLSGKPTENDLAEADGKLAVAKSKLDDAKRQVIKLSSGPDPDDLALTQARLENASAQLAAAQAVLRNLELHAPFAGSVVTVDVAANEHVAPGQSALLLADLSQWYVDTSDLTELDVVKLSAGKAVNVTPDALPELSLQGHVDRISQGFTEKGGDILYQVHIQLDKSDPRLRWGMTVKVSFLD